MLQGCTISKRHEHFKTQSHRFKTSQDLMIRHFIRYWMVPQTSMLTHWGRVTHICVGNLTIIGSDNGLSPGRRQAIIWTNAGILWIGPLGTNFSEIFITIHTFSFKKMHLKMPSAKWRPFFLSLDMLTLHMVPTFSAVTWDDFFLP